MCPLEGWRIKAAMTVSNPFRLQGNWLGPAAQAVTTPQARVSPLLLASGA